MITKLLDFIKKADKILLKNQVLSKNVFLIFLMLSICLKYPELQFFRLMSLLFLLLQKVVCELKRKRKLLIKKASKI